MSGRGLAKQKARSAESVAGLLHSKLEDGSTYYDAIAQIAPAKFEGSKAGLSEGGHSFLRALVRQLGGKQHFVCFGAIVASRCLNLTQE